ncbi:MAG: tetraacyldisaccharide 4'-kinase [Candidatus Omnitrophica bacterium]|nr:tetraacyldisaccharide 4'-kinase [Candidatus Omnitrophota bacterium]
MREFLYNLATDKHKGIIFVIFKALLFILSLIYTLIVRALVLFYSLRPCRLDCKVISVGNITVGGTGKTVLVEYIARYLQSQGRKVAILSRGYKKRVTTSPRHHVTNVEAMGDEPYMLYQKLEGIPVIVNPDRIKGAKQAIKEYGADTVILDDGFQQWRIKKDLDIVAIDAGNPFGNRRLLPRGILREPLSSLKRADIFVLTKTNLHPDIQGIETSLARINPQAQVFAAGHQARGFYEIARPDELLGLDSLAQKTVALFCGIGDPDSFEQLVLGLGIKAGLSFRFCDHYHYAQVDLDKIIQAAKEKNIDTIITTEKDAARLYAMRSTLYALRILVLRIQIEFKNEQTFHHRLLRIYSA